MNRKIKDLLVLRLRPNRRLVLVLAGLVFLRMLTYEIYLGTKCESIRLMDIWEDTLSRWVQGESRISAVPLLVLFTGACAAIAWAIGWAVAALVWLSRQLLVRQPEDCGERDGPC